MFNIAKKLQFNSATATEYDRGIRRTLPTYDILFRLVQAHFRQHLPQKSDLLIVGAGGGTELALLGPANPEWTFTAVDPSQAMLDLARDKVRQEQLEGRVQFIEGTIEDVSQIYDAATLMLVLHFIQDEQDKRTLLTHIRSRLKTGAPFVLASMYGDMESVSFQEQIALWRAYWLDTTQLTEQEMDDMERSIRHLSFISEEQLERMLQDAGFTQIAKVFQTNMFGGWVCRAN